MYCIYLHRNRTNGLVYIGQTKYGDNPNQRWQNGMGYRENKRFFQDIVKYGWQNFDHEILSYCLTSKEAGLKERYYIQLFNANDPSKGYNLAKGGRSSAKLTKTDKPWYNDINGILRGYK